MDYTKVCRLCVNNFEDGKPLYDENGRANVLHEITCKYFHPQIVNIFEAKYLTSICSVCWRYLSEFHSFETTIQLAQLKLLEIKAPKKETDTRNDAQLANNFPTLTNLLEKPGVVQKDQEDVSKTPINEATDNNDDNNASEQGPSSVANMSLEDDRSMEATPSPSDSETPIEIIDLDSDNEVQPNKHKKLNTCKTVAQMKVSPAISDQLNGTRIGRLNEFLKQWLPQIKCGTCETVCQTISELENHFIERHPKAPIYIICCSRLIQLRCANEHALLHKNPNSFKCNLCGKLYGGRSSLKLHVSKVHPEHIQFHCKICGDKQSSYQLQVKHYSEKHSTGRPIKPIKNSEGRPKYPCHLCSNKAASVLSYYHHYWFEHQHLKSVYHCDACDKTYPFSEHICPGASSEKQNDSSSVLNSSSGGKKFDCSDCDSSFDTEREVIEHLAAQHRKIDLYTCPCCLVTFDAVTKIPQHRKQHHPNEAKADYYLHMDYKFDKLLKEYLAKTKNTYQHYVGDLIRIRDRRRYRDSSKRKVGGEKEAQTSQRRKTNDDDDDLMVVGSP
ncbi:transcription factor grauzone isoform X1 [Musca domestica]|uniref:Transcription factor grauzone isoform X1 n=1 Tax=Musca domestica TaxID=7370 RepID=A0A9J7D6R3_MUSDO|nr:transcription factor grauzone isoform X1 [Musca domestica]XP_011293486.2 transcription factor grauzone isoform X1 [Musca domestica]XP_011293487.2 transcription factor grauzone isoform X1 [Musca domestica]